MKLLSLFTLAIINLEASKITPKEIHCLTQNIYFESRGSNLADKASVADVVLNRVKHTSYPNTVCGVVRQAKLWNGNPIKNKCQFSWYCDGKSDKMKDKDAYEEAKLIAYSILVEGKYKGISEGSTHYHANYVEPYWAKSFQLVGTIGKHIFYRQD